MVRFPWLFPSVLRRSGSLGSICATTKSVFQEGHVSVVQGAVSGTPAMQKIVGAIKEGAEVFLKRQYKTVAALLCLMLPTFAYAQTEHAGGGEASLTLPDLRTVHFVNFFGLNGH